MCTQAACESEIAELEYPIRGREDVFWFDVAMDDLTHEIVDDMRTYIARMAEVESAEQLEDVFPDGDLGVKATTCANTAFMPC